MNPQVKSVPASCGCQKDLEWDFMCITEWQEFCKSITVRS